LATIASRPCACRDPLAPCSFICPVLRRCIGKKKAQYSSWAPAMFLAGRWQRWDELANLMIGRRQCKPRFESLSPGHGRNRSGFPLPGSLDTGYRLQSNLHGGVDVSAPPRLRSSRTRGENRGRDASRYKAILNHSDSTIRLHIVPSRPGRVYR